MHIQYNLPIEDQYSALSLMKDNLESLMNFYAVSEVRGANDNYNTSILHTLKSRKLHT